MATATESMKTEIVTQDQTQQPIATAPRDPTADASPEWRQVLREAEKLACASLCPAHLKVQMPPIDGSPGNEQKRRAAWNQMVGNCILVSNQARKWGADTFAVAAESYVVGNKLGYQGKLIAAVVNARAGLSEPIQSLYSTGKGDDFAAVIYGSEDAVTGEARKEMFSLLKRYADSTDQEANRALAEMGVLTVRVSVGQCKTDNKMWRTDPEQKLFYTGCTKWARRHKPELMLGILSDDDLDYMKMMERKEHHTAQQSRVNMVIPAAIDASGFVPQPQANEDEQQSTADRVAQSSTPDFNAEPVRTTDESQEEPPADLDAEQWLADWQGMLAEATDISAVGELEGRVKPPLPLADRAKAMAEQRREAIRGKRGGRGQKSFT